MSDLTSFARDTERRLSPPDFASLTARHRRAHRRRALVASTAVMAAVIAVTVVAGLGRDAASRTPSAPVPAVSSATVPDWGAAEVVGHPDAFVTAQFESRADRRIVLTVWKRCVVARSDHDCLGREAIAVVDGLDHRFLVLGGVTRSSAQPSVGTPGLFREVADGVWYWAHQDPGPYLVSTTMHQPVRLTVMDRPVAPRFGASAVECADGVGLCSLDVNARTLERLALPEAAPTRWATPVERGCGIWGLAGAGSDLRLVIQQRDGSFASADLPDDSLATSLAEGGGACEVAYYQSTHAAGVAARTRLVVSLDQGATWQERRAPHPADVGLVEARPRLRVLIPPGWASLPQSRAASATSSALPARLVPL